MSAKSRRPPRPQAGPLPVMTLEAVQALVAGPEPACCAHHRTEYQAIVGLIRNPEGQAVCLLCGSPATLRGVFIPHPENVVKFGGRVGKRRILVYGMDEHCWRLPDREARVEAHVLADVRRAQAHWN